VNTSSDTSVPGHIYLIDDDASIRRALSGTLERLGYSVSVYEAPDEFLKSAVPVSPAVILLDMRMPGKSGVEVQAELIVNKWHTPIIFISGESLPAQIVRAMKQGATDFLLKPFSMESLLRAVDSGLAKDAEQHALLLRSLNIQQRYNLLTPREKEVCADIISGRSNKEIAEISGSAAATIKLHRARVLSKMQAKSLSDLIAMFEGTNLLTEPNKTVN
jgi:FixJ family two-component response regulator